MRDKKLPECCRPKHGKAVRAGILSGLIPHTGCILILLFAIFGVTFANAFFKKFLFNSYYIYAVFGVSILIATIAGFFYIRRFSDRRLKSHWKYLIILYGSVIIINLLMIYVIFPAIANTNSGNLKGDLLNLEFNIPCSGHVPLVISELQKVDGVKGVKFISGKTFEVYYDANKITEEKILQQDVCREFNAKEINKEDKR